MVDCIQETDVSGLLGLSEVNKKFADSNILPEPERSVIIEFVADINEDYEVVYGSDSEADNTAEDHTAAKDTVDH